MCEGVGEDSRHGMACRHSSRNVHIFTLTCVHFPLHVHLGGE